MRISPSYYEWAGSRASRMPAISKPQAQSAFTHFTTHYLPSQAPILPPLKQKAGGPASDLARLLGPLQPLTLTPYSLCSLIWQPGSDLPFLFLSSASMLPPACQYLTTLSSYITSPALNPTPSIARGCACSSQFNSTSLYRVPSTHSSLSASAKCLLGQRNEKPDPLSQVEETGTVVCDAAQHVGEMEWIWQETSQWWPSVTLLVNQAQSGKTRELQIHGLCPQGAWSQHRGFLVL